MERDVLHLSNQGYRVLAVFTVNMIKRSFVYAAKVSIARQSEPFWTESC